MSQESRVITLGPMPPEKLAYALARYSRSPDSVQDSLRWVREHDSAKFLESYYFQYGHASIADLGHLALCFEGISELAACEIEDEQLWDGQARSSRYQDFSKGGCVVPPELSQQEAPLYVAATQSLLRLYQHSHQVLVEHLKEKLPRPQEMKPDTYHRTLSARAFDVARYLLFFGVPTGVGQVTSIRTLERQIRRMRASAYAEVRAVAAEAARALAEPPTCRWAEDQAGEPVAPTLAKYMEPDAFLARSAADVLQWAQQNLPLELRKPRSLSSGVELSCPSDPTAEIAATLLYPATTTSFRELYALVEGWSRQRQMEVIETALRGRGSRDELPRAFRTGQFVFDIVTDIGAYRDLHRHRRCQQFRQEYGWAGGFEIPPAVSEAGLDSDWRKAFEQAQESASKLPAEASHYLLPFAARGRFLFKMDFAEAEYICRLRSGVKGHFSYRQTAWLMKKEMERVAPELGRRMDATPPWVEEPLKR